MKHAGERESEMRAVVVRGLRRLAGRPAQGKRGAYLSTLPSLDLPMLPTDRMSDWMKPAGVGKHAEVRDGS